MLQIILYYFKIISYFVNLLKATVLKDVKHFGNTEIIVNFPSCTFPSVAIFSL